MNGCGKYEDALLDLVYGELDEIAAEALRSHTAACPACASAVEEMSSTRRISAQIIHPEAPLELDAVIMAEARASVIQTDKNVAPKPVVDRPGFFESLKALLLHPAFAGATVVALLIVITVFISNRAQESASSTTTVESIIEERSVQVYAPPPQSPSPTVATAPNVGPAQLSVESQKPDAIQEARPSTLPKMESLSSPGEGTLKGGGTGYSRERAPLGSRRMSSAPVSQPEAASMSRDESSRHSPSSAKSPAKRRSVDFDDVLPSYGAAPSPAPKLSEPQQFAPPPPEKKEALGNDKVFLENSAPAAEASADEASAGEFEAAPAPNAEVPARKSKAAPAPVGSSQARRIYEDEETSTTAKSGRVDDAYNTGMDAYRRGDCDNAVSDLLKVVSSPSLYPGKAPSALHHIARCEKRTGKCAKAVGYYDQLINQYSSYTGRPDALYEAAACYKRLGRTDKARSLLNFLRSIPGFESRAEEALRQL